MAALLNSYGSQEVVVENAKEKTKNAGRIYILRVTCWRRVSHHFHNCRFL